MQKYFNLISLCVLALIFVCPQSLAATFGKEANKTLDVRILVDVSKNMATSDIEGFRQSSIVLFAKLLPNGARTGIWMFDDRVTEIMPLSKVSDGWRAKALLSVKKIYAKGEVSHLEKALAVSTLDWVVPDNTAKRHVVVLTDGQVSVGSNKKNNLASKDRIQTIQLERLKKLGVYVHVIAFSDDADKELLEKLAMDTNGWYDWVKTPAQLERALLRVNKRLVQKNSIPIVANKFVIDDAVRQFTAVVFRKKGFGATQLDDPEGMDFGRDNKPNGVDWHREKRYDIVTVTNPIEGDWRLIAPASPDNEIFITTKLQMAVDRLPKVIISGEDSRIKMLLAEKGKLVTNSNFLDVVKATIELKNKRGKKTVIDMEQDMIAGGYFFADIGKDLKEGAYEMVVRAKGNTFERVETMTIHVGPKPKEKTVEIKPEFRKVLTDAGIEVPEEVTDTEQTDLSCPEAVGEDKGKDEATGEEVAEVEEAEESNWMVTAGIILLVNLLLGAAGFFGFRFFKGRAAKADEALINKLST